MLQILLHSSKTMASKSTNFSPLGTPLFRNEAATLAKILSKASSAQLEEIMQISAKKANEVAQLYAAWSPAPSLQSPAVDAFKGDIYSGLQVMQWSEDDRAYAHNHLVILSGLYGALRACDGIMPYRLEMGYKLPGQKSLYTYWDNKLGKIIDPATSHIINLSAVEYTKALLPYVKVPVITPRFMTVDAKTGEPNFVTVHAKIARGAFARWQIQNRIDRPKDILQFNDLDYRYDEKTSTPLQPVFICESFQGIGLSVRIPSKK